MPEVLARRPYQDDGPGGHKESLRDWAMNNSDAVEWFLTNHKKIRDNLDWAKWRSGSKGLYKGRSAKDWYKLHEILRKDFKRVVEARQ